VANVSDRAEPVRCVAVAPDPDVVAVRPSLSWELVIVAAVALATLPVLHLCNRLSTRRTLVAVAWLARLPIPGVRCDPARVGRAVNGVASRLRMQGTTCLARSQLIWLLLSLCGQHPVIHVGAGAGLGAGTLAHAWVELDGVPVADAADIATLHPPFDRPLLGLPAEGQLRSQ
jgi:hypothetical protein